MKKAGRPMTKLPEQFPEWFVKLPADACLSAAEIGRVLGVGPIAIFHRGKRQSEGFPKPSRFYANHHTHTRWRVADIRAWIKSQRQKETA